MIVYKYMKSAHAERSLREGSVRLGTLYEFRDEERHGSAIGDKDEGIKRTKTETRITGRDINRRYKHHFPPNVVFADRAQFIADDGVPVFEITQQSPNCYLYCATLEASKKAMVEFGCDAIVRISDFEMFSQIIMDALISNGESIIGGDIIKCVYIKRDLRLDQATRHHPAAIKDPQYAYQKEFRAVISPPTGSIIQPQVVVIPNLISLLSIVG